MDEEADRGAHAHGREHDDGIDWILHCVACRLGPLTGSEQTMTASGDGYSLRTTLPQ
jgi:hypothetical protein